MYDAIERLFDGKAWIGPAAVLVLAAAGYGGARGALSTLAPEDAQSVLWPTGPLRDSVRSGAPARRPTVTELTLPPAGFEPEPAAFHAAAGPEALPGRNALREDAPAAERGADAAGVPTDANAERAALLAATTPGFPIGDSAGDRPASAAPAERARTLPAVDALPRGRVTALRRLAVSRRSETRPASFAHALSARLSGTIGTGGASRTGGPTTTAANTSARRQDEAVMEDAAGQAAVEPSARPAARLTSSVPEAGRAVDASPASAGSRAPVPPRLSGATARCRALTTGTESAEAAARALRQARTAAKKQLASLLREAEVAAAKALAQEKPLPARLGKRFECVGCEKVNACLERAQGLSEDARDALGAESARLEKALLTLVPPPIVANPMSVPPKPSTPAWLEPTREALESERKATGAAGRLLKAVRAQQAACVADIPKELTVCESHPAGSPCRKEPYAKGESVKQAFAALALDVSVRQERTLALLPGWLRGKRPAAPADAPARLLKSHNESVREFADWLPEGLNSGLEEAEYEYGRAVRSIAKTADDGRLYVEGVAGIVAATKSAERGVRAWRKARGEACAGEPIAR
ncbi:MAG: hypothetical protein HY553_20760 [Elusimicrobia bacterium]|nr:hypothetical protein [Elusimicrobiota bacterium]